MGFNYGDILKQAKVMQQQMAKIQEELKNMEFEASAGGGVVKVKVNGEQEVLSVAINKEMVDIEDLEMLEDMVLVATNDAISQSKAESKARMASLTGGMNMPGMF
jgi:nucleoid-associated protein EbfC